MIRVDVRVNVIEPEQPVAGDEMENPEDSAEIE
jgi:hypothetical protein